MSRIKDDAEYTEKYNQAKEYFGGSTAAQINAYLEAFDVRAGICSVNRLIGEIMIHLMEIRQKEEMEYW